MNWSVVVIAQRGPQFMVIARKFNPRDINFPGGRKDPEDAAPADTAVRELYEETGLRTTSEFLRLIDMWQGDQGEPVYAYLVTGYQGRLRASEEGKPFWTAYVQKLVSKSSTFHEKNAQLLRKIIKHGRAEIEMSDGVLRLRPKAS